MTRDKTQITVAACCAMAILLMGTPASAEWGDGVGDGAFRLHPGLTLSAGYDTNIFHSSRSQSGSLIQAPAGTMEPSLSVVTVEPGAWDLSGKAAVGWQQYFRGENTVRTQSGLSASVDGSALWNSEGAFSLQFSEQFVRTNETPNYASSGAINRIFNKAGVQAGIHPGGKILQTFLSYDFSLYRHSRFQDLDRHSHGFGLDGSWAFLPKTNFVLEVDYRLIRYQQSILGQDRVSNPEGRLINSNSAPLRLTGGISGQITQRISLDFRGGYGWGFYEQGPTTSQGLASTTASYQFGNIDFDNRLRLGYRYGFNDSSIANFYAYHRAVAGYQQGFMGNRLRLDVGVDAQMRNYASLGIEEVVTEENTINIPDELSDLLLGVKVQGRYAIRKGWDVGIRYGFNSNFTGDRIEVEGLAEDSLRDYDRHNVLLTTTLTY